MTPPNPHPLRRAAAMAVARLRFVLLAGGLLAVLAGWPYLRAAFDKLTAPPPAVGGISANTEYWCPMCPGVLSDWPTKCPVCSMSLVRRQKGDMTPLPDGVVARVQLSPYRVQLAGIRTAPVEFRRLEWEVTVGGRLDSLGFAADVFEPDASALTVGQTAAVEVDGFPGEPAVGRVADIALAAVPAAGKRVRVVVEDSRGQFRSWLYAAARFRSPVAGLDVAKRAERGRWAEHLALSAIAKSEPAALLEAAIRQAAARHGLTLCVPEPAVIDTGTRRVVYVESMPGVYDAVEVTLGRRCGDHYPVRSGLEVGQRVATAGAVLLDAETRLNPNVAAGYFGAGTRPAQTSTTPAAPAASEDDALLIAKQKICPVTDEPLGSMGPPVKVSVNGRAVFVCCKGCEKPLLRSPAEHLAKLPK